MAVQTKQYISPLQNLFLQQLQNLYRTKSGLESGESQSRDLDIALQHKLLTRGIYSILADCADQNLEVDALQYALSERKILSGGEMEKALRDYMQVLSGRRKALERSQNPMS